MLKEPKECKKQEQERERETKKEKINKWGVGGLIKKDQVYFPHIATDPAKTFPQCLPDRF